MELPCPRCHGSGWQCEDHPTMAKDHALPNGAICGGAGSPCEEVGCPYRTHPTDAMEADRRKKVT